MISSVFNCKIRIASLLFSFLLLSQNSTVAQCFLETSPNDIFDALSAHNEGEGDIFIRQPKELRQFVGKVAKRGFCGQQEDEEFSLIQGYRIQAYNGNLPNSKQEAYARANTLSKLFPEEVCYITYRTPFWRLVMGDFMTIEEAREALSALKEVAPVSMLDELYIVKDKIRIQP